MKFRNIKTIEHVLKEYGATPGAPTYNKGGTASQKPKAKSPNTNPPKSSPVTTGVQPKDPIQPFVPAKAGELGQGDSYYDDKGNELGVVKTSIGDGPNPDAVVVQDPKNKKYSVVDADDELNINNPDYAQESSSKINKLLNKTDKKNRLHRKIKKLIRKNKLIEQGKEQLFEINFNNKKLAKEALDLPIKCGFEAETSWEGISDTNDEDDWLYEYNWYDIEDFLNDQEGRRAVQEINESYQEWLGEKAMDYEQDVIDELVADRKEEENELNDFIDSSSGPSSEAVEQYKAEFEEDDPVEFQNREEDGWNYMNWVREFVEEEYEAEYLDWLEETIRDEGEAMDRAYEIAGEENDIDTWANDEYGSWSSTLSEHGYYLSNPDGEGRGLAEVSEYVETWADDNSERSEVRYGDYHSYYGANQTYWRVESDSSIDSYGTGAEIISPVYETPRTMLTEMKSLFDMLQQNNVETNNSTGLHVTMSYAGKNDDDYANGITVNKVKLAILLGDKYLLSTFGRKGNSYAKSQMASLEKLAYKLKADPDNVKTIQNIEQILASGIQGDKFTAINFKDQLDGDTKNQLIEFRIGGGHDYHNDFPTTMKAVVRYATTLSAAYSETAYKGDYVKALFRLINNVGKISADDEESVKGKVDHPAIDALKNFFGKENFVKYMHYLTGAFEMLERYKEASAPGADEKWKQKIADYEKATGEKVEIEEVTEGEPIRGYMKPDATAPSRNAPYYLSKAQRGFVLSVAQAGYDLSQNLNRKPVNAKTIGILRNTLKDFELNYQQFDKIMKDVEDEITISADRHTKIKPSQRFQRIKNGVDRLFKKDVLKEPEYISISHVERAIQGMWHAVNSEEIKDSEQSKQFIKMGADAMPGTNTDSKQDRLAIMLDDMGTIGREYKEFHRHLVSGSYSYGPLFEPGTPYNKKAFNKFMDHLKQYPEWNHPVSRKHNPNLTGDDSYRENALSKIMQKLRMRWEHLEDIKEENPSVYHDTMKEIGDLVEYLIDMNKADTDDKLAEIMAGEGIEDTEFKDDYDGPEFLGMRRGVANNLTDALDAINRPDPFGEPVAHRLRDNIQNYISSSFERYYTNKIRHGKDYYDKVRPVQALVQGRLDVIQEFLEEFDKISQKLGFDSQQKALDQKRKLDDKEKEFKKKHGAKYVGTINTYDFGGNVFISNSFASDLKRGTNIDDRTIYRYTEPGRNSYRSERGDVLVIPNAHYFTALDAYEVSKSDNYKGTWRESVAKNILDKFRDLYSVHFQQIDDYFVDINKEDLKQKLKDARVNIDKNLGDGRTGMGPDPLLPSDEMQGPFGEPFSPSSAVSWKVNNPKLASKAKAKEQEYLNSIERQIPIHADVLDYEGSSSNTIEQYANYIQLANYLKIDAGVEKQGINLLKRVTDSYNSNDMPGAEGFGMERFVSAVKLAKQYIEQNYMVSGGNYFRKDAEGKPGDDIGGLYTNRSSANVGELDSIELTDTSYQEARGNYEIFDEMMQNGMQNYMVQADVNRLVKFLVGGFSENYKLSVLRAMKKNATGAGRREPVDIQQALELGRNAMTWESVFTKFDKLPLIEKLQLLDKVDANKINEAWSKKYKNSINCSNPKGFSQKAHCAGKKKNEGDVSNSLDRRRAQKGKDKYHKAVDVPVSRKIAPGQNFDKFVVIPSENGKVGHMVGVLNGKAEDLGASAIELANALVDAYNRGGFTDLPLQKIDLGESVPNNDKIHKLTKLLKEPILASDLKAQMEVYFVLPVPSMIRDFKTARAQNGDNADLRHIVKGYMDMLHKDDQKRLKKSLKENRYITVNEYDDLGSEKENIIKTISGLDASNEAHAQLLDRIYKLLNSEHIDSTMGVAFQKGVADELMPEKEKAKVIQDMTRIIGGIDSDYGTMNKFLKRLETTGTIVNLKELAQPINTFQSVFGDDTAINAFIALADYGVGKKQKGPGEYALACLSNQIRLAEGEGDLEIEGIGKVELKAALSSSGGRIGYGGGSQKAKRAVLDKYAESIPTVMQSIGGVGGSLGLPAFVKALNIDLPPTDVNNQKVRKAIATELLVMDLENFAGPVIDTIATSQDLTAIEDSYLAQNLRWYQDRDHFDALLLMHIPNRKTGMIRTPEDLIAFRRSGHANSTSISIIPTQAGAGREQWAQLTLNKGTV